jgi:hypothetical protein
MQLLWGKIDENIYPNTQDDKKRKFNSLFAHLLSAFVCASSGIVD